MKKISFLIFLLFLIAPVCFSQIKISADTGYLGLDVKELLWNQPGEQGQINSLLDWQTFVAPVVSLNAQYSINQNNLIGFGGFYTVPFSYGIMEDFDYMNILSTGTKERTHYSKHTNKLENYYTTNFFFGTGNNITQNLKLTALFSVSYSYYRFTAKDGYKQYGQETGYQNEYKIYSPWNANIPKTAMKGNIISLETETYYLGLGTKLDYFASDNLLISFKFNLLPSLLCHSLDTHYRRSTKYSYFDLSNDLAFDSAILLEYKLNKNNAFNATLDCFFSPAKKGKLLQGNDKKNWLVCANQSGIKETVVKLLFGYTYIYEK